MKKTLNDEKGITLIALVITIIVMLILVTVTIRVATNGALFNHAANAVKGTKSAIADENAILNDELDSSIEDIVAGQTGTSTHVRNPYANENFAKAWTCTGGIWDEPEITDNSATLTGDIVAKLYEKDGGYHLVLEKIGERGQVGRPQVQASVDNIKLANNFKGIIDDSKPLILAKQPTTTWTCVAYALYSEQIKKVYVCDGIDVLGESAFSNCSTLTSIELPNTIESIGENAFAFDTITINYRGTIADWLSIDIASNQGSGWNPTTINCTDGSGTPEELEALREPEEPDPSPGGGLERR